MALLCCEGNKCQLQSSCISALVSIFSYVVSRVLNFKFLLNFYSVKCSINGHPMPKLEPVFLIWALSYFLFSMLNPILMLYSTHEIHKNK